MTQSPGIFNGLTTGLYLAFSYWWVWVPIVLGVAAYRAWFEYQRAKFLSGLKWVMLEVIPPPDVPFSSPKAADNIFSGLHATYAGASTWKGQFFQGKVPVWFSFEIVSNGGQISFFIRCLQEQRNVIENLIFSQYPESEIRIVPDYVEGLPATLDLSQYDISGAELEFTKDQAYPIKTYPEFEEAGGKDEYARLDPIAPLVEVMGTLQPHEFLGLQYLIRATGADWSKEGSTVVNKLIGKEEKPAGPGIVGTIILFPLTLLNMVSVGLGLTEKVEEKKKEEKPFSLQGMTPAQKEVLERVEYKLAKQAFKTGIRLVYTAPKDGFDGSRIASVTAMFKQLYYNNLNSFKPGNSTRDKGFLKWIFPSDVGFGAGARTARKKEAMYAQYRTRNFPNRAFPKTRGEDMLCILTTEELATLWHLPGLNVKAPLLPRVQAKKGQPPAILPTR